MFISKMLCELLENPLSVDRKTPQLGWMFSPTQTEIGKFQTAYHLLVASTPEILSQNQGDLWDTGKIESDQSIFIKYRGKELLSRHQYFWKVKFWDEQKLESEWSQMATWTMGIFPENWNGQWIGERIQVKYEDRFPVSTELEECPPFMRATARKMHPHGSGPENDYAQAVYLRKEFEAKPSLQKAILRIAGIGYYEVYINGEKIGDHVLDPGATDYTKTILYSSYDITKEITATENCLGVILGNGWYWVGTPDLFGFEKALWAAPPKCRIELELHYSDGSQQFIRTDETWMCSTQGPIKFNSIRSGEIYDARMDLGKWSQKGGIKIDDGRWKPVTIVPDPKGTLRSQLSPPIKVMDTFGPCKRVNLNNGSIVYWFPKNNAGWITVKIKGTAGQTVKIELNEKLNPDGSVDMDTHSGHTYGTYQTLEYICKGSGIETYAPRFCYAGFQYVQISGVKEEQIIEILANQVCTSFESAGQFDCSNLLINAINSASKATFLNGFHSYPEDCPQREKAGWTEDACLSAHGSIYNFNTILAYKKWIQDLMDAQHESGQVPDIVPTPFWGKPSKVRESPILGQWTEEFVGKMADPWWGGVIVLLPWRLYEHYGDPTLLEHTYPAMKKYMAFLLKTTEIALHDYTYIIDWSTLLGEWLEVGSNGSANRTPRQLTCTQAFYYYATIIAKIAHLLRESDDEKYYNALSTKIFDAFNEEYLNKTKGIYCEDSQSADAMALIIGITPIEFEKKIFDHLKTNVVSTHQGHLTTGIVGTYFLYKALCSYGQPEIAFQVITAKGFPGFEHNLTRITEKTPLPSSTLWEDWGGVSSLAHPVQGTVVSFFYEWLAGIQSDINAPGFKKFKIKPQIVGDLLWVKCTLPTLYGNIVSNWKRKERTLTMEIEIPVNTSAKICFPIPESDKISMGSDKLQIGKGIENISTENELVTALCSSGKYEFRMEFP